MKKIFVVSVLILWSFGSQADICGLVDAQQEVMVKQLFSAEGRRVIGLNANYPKTWESTVIKTEELKFEDGMVTFRGEALDFGYLFVENKVQPAKSEPVKFLNAGVVIGCLGLGDVGEGGIADAIVTSEGLKASSCTVPTEIEEDHEDVMDFIKENC